ncbi:MAG: hypothetical protein AB4042_21830 [Leptolyngbyaceae cyanobacterium]
MIDGVEGVPLMGGQGGDVPGRTPGLNREIGLGRKWGCDRHPAPLSIDA